MNLKSVHSKILSYEETLRELCNNIEVIMDEETICNDVNQNIRDSLNKLDKKKVIIDIAKDIPINLIYDETKLLSAVKLIIKKSIDNCIKDKIKLSVKMIEKKNCNIKLKISIENVKLSDQNIEVLDKIFKHHFIDEIKDPELLVIRSNLFCLHSKIDMVENKGIVCMIINLPVIKPKEERIIPRALIVDDSKHTAIMNQDVLKELGIDADVVFSAEECLEKIKDNMDDYDIIFTDNQMPNMCGSELFRELKELDNFNLPVVIVTGDQGEEYRFKTIYGFDDYIEKPLDKNKAKKVINKLLKKNVADQ